MPSRKSSTSWSILPTTLPVNTFKKLWSFFWSSTLCIANKLKKEKAASQAKTEKFYIQANIYIGDTDSIFPHCSQHPLQRMFSSLHSTLKILTYLVFIVSKVHYILVSTDYSPFQTPLYVPLLLCFKTDSLLFPKYPKQFHTCILFIILDYLTFWLVLHSETSLRF